MGLIWNTLLANAMVFPIPFYAFMFLEFTLSLKKANSLTMVEVGVT
jgi:hypothetical protein